MDAVAADGRRSAPVRLPRRAVVLGGGGVLGYAWTLGALAALEEAFGFDAREMDVALGTSAGAIVAALLGCGLPVATMCRHHQGRTLPGDPVIEYDYDRIGGVVRPRPALRPGAPRLLLEALRRPLQVPVPVALSGLLPAGRGSLAQVHDMVELVAARAGFADRWPGRPRPWIVALDQSTGRRVVFGRDDVVPGSGRRVRIVRPARLADAVTASCSVPGWYPPTEIDGVRYADGGIASNASADLLAGTAVDEVFVLVPMAGADPGRPATAAARVDRALRRWVRGGVARDVARLRRQGAAVRVLAPGPEESAMMINLMDPTRRVEVLDAARDACAERLRRAQVPSIGPAAAGTPRAGSAR